MPGRSPDLCRWLFLAVLFCCSSCQSATSTFENKTGQNESKPRVFSPRMDYDEWTPLGRGDPLKNNPTFDYVPPVLDRVQYWLDSHTTEPSAKRDILVLGVTAKKTSPKIPEQFFKFVDGPKFTRSNHQDVSYRNDFTGSTGAEPPKLVRTTNFRNGPIDYRNQNRIQSMPASYYPSPFYNQKTKPYTMMLPPPLTQKDKIVSFVEPTQQFNTQTEEGPVLQESQFYVPLHPSKSYNQQQPGKSQSQSQASSSKFPPSKNPTQTVSTQVETVKSAYGPASSQPTKLKYESLTTPSVSFEKSNLIYQSTQTLSAAGWPSAGTNGAPFSTPTISDVGQSIRQTTDYSRDQYEIDHHVAAASSNHEVVVEQNANIIVDGDSNENEEVVIGQKGAVDSSNTVSSAATTATTTTVADPHVGNGDRGKTEEDSTTDRSVEKMHIVVANSPQSVDVESHEAKKGAVAVVMPTNYSEKWSSYSPTSTVTPQVTTAPETATIGVQDTYATGTGTGTGTEMASDISSKLEFQPIRNSVIGSPMSSESSQSSVILPSKMMSPVHQQHAVHFHSTMTPPPFPSRHPADPLHAFAPPPAPLSSMMHPQARPNHGTMHLIGGMRPTMGFRAPASMPVFPPMTHMHAPPPVRSPIDHVGSPMIAMDQSSVHRPPQLQQDFPVGMFVDSPAPSTLLSQAIGADDHFFDRHRSRVPESTTSIYTTPTSSPFLPTVSSSLENSPMANTRTQASETGKIVASNEKEEHEQGEEEAEDERKKVSIGPTTTPRITTVPSLTTDPIFSHYKQPAKPIRGPMYLIIQGHSKVKTYKPTVSKHGVSVEGNEIPESITEKQLSKFEQFVQENTRNGNRANVASIEEQKKKKKAEDKARAEKLARARQNDLMSLVESGLASFTVSPSSSTTEDERRGNSVTMIEINGN
ncbi:PREDICTED: uncharacterized protein LOC108550757 [Eufriesea mexicana]|uniref:uncharacterized protein LOC108550757 n=1 Tax=Eufriesea mexicana TaxID=516756 RepID=UPI00083BBA1D|nr:PREDICTED: uncharacterized protein LOC108550757 [Eufriesea mexicana]